MANSEHTAKLKEGVEAWNDWRKANAEIVPDLFGADLGGESLRDANLSGVNLGGANLSQANLTDAVLYQANLSGANLHSAHLDEALLNETELTQADLSGASLTGAELTWAHLRGANLSRADITGASIGWTTFGDNDLSAVKGLETVQHKGPSTIGIDTIYRSHGDIPLAFLRGAGVPENFIQYMESLTRTALEFDSQGNIPLAFLREAGVLDNLIEYMGSVTEKPFEFYSCFISYSTKDQEFADRLYADLQNKGVRCWFAPHDIQAGKKIHEQIDEAIRRYERLLLILSTNSMKSPWVKTEIRKARKREIEEKRRVLFPVSIVPFTDIRTWDSFYADEGIDLAEEIREYYIPDFSDWKNHDSYAEGLKKLLGGLKAEGSKAA